MVIIGYIISSPCFLSFGWPQVHPGPWDPWDSGRHGSDGKCRRGHSPARITCRVADTGISLIYQVIYRYLYDLYSSR